MKNNREILHEALLKAIADVRVKQEAYKLVANLEFDNPLFVAADDAYTLAYWEFKHASSVYENCEEVKLLRASQFNKA